MKRVRVKYLNQNAEAEGLLFENVGDLKLLREELTKAEEGVMMKFIKSGESYDRLNHIVSGFQPLERSIANLAILKRMISGINPIYNLGICSEEYLNTLRSQLVKGRTVFMNKNGGLCPVEGTLEILEIIEDSAIFKKYPKYYIGKAPKVINLENDFEIESVARDYMRKTFGDSHYAHITDMKTLSEREFNKIFKEFVEKGGEYVYVYTTGLDYEQMYEYSKYALQNGIRKFIFDFNCGIDKDIQKFVDWLSERAKVEVI